MNFEKKDIQARVITIKGNSANEIKGARYASPAGDIVQMRFKLTIQKSFFLLITTSAISVVGTSAIASYVTP